MTHLIEDFVDFLIESPTSFHAAQEMGMRLASLDFTPLDMKEKWDLKKGERYFVVDQGTLISFHLPEGKPEQITAIAAHTDSPALKLKPNHQTKCGNMVSLGVEVYGSPTLHTWLNRDLAIAGRVVVEKQKGKIEEELVYFDSAPVIIPLIAPHLDRDIFNKGLSLNKQDHIAPVATLVDGDLSVPYIEALLKEEISFRKLLDFDLFLVPIDPPRKLGLEQEMLASYRMDNLSSAHAALVAAGKLEKAPKKTLPICLFYDHEEVGSATATGAHSPLLPDLLRRLSEFYKLTAEEEVIMKSRSICASVDLSHALNPNYKKKHDPAHEPLLGKGVVIKYNADQKYTSNARTGGEMVALCEAIDLSYQKFVNRSDNRAGSTVGPILAAQMGFSVVDIGLAQLSMHAAREVISCQDQIDLSTLLTHYLAQEL